MSNLLRQLDYIRDEKGLVNRIFSVRLELVLFFAILVKLNKTQLWAQTLPFPQYPDVHGWQPGAAEYHLLDS